MPLTIKQIDALKPKEKDYKATDGGGLFLLVTKTGSKLWKLKYYYLGKEKKLAFGPYPTVSLSEARDKRDEAKKLLANGHDPSAIRQEIKQEKIQENANTFESIAREWHEHKKPEWSATNAKTVIDRLERDVFPALGKYPIKTITHKMLLELAQKIKERGAHELAKRIIQISSKIYQYAIVTGRAAQNIAADLKGMVKSQPKNHHAAIEAKEIPKFLNDLENHKHNLNRQTYLAVMFMMLTFVRTNEMMKAEWDDFDLEEKVWLIPAHKMKMKKDHIVPLSDQALKILSELRRLHNHPKWVFPSRVRHEKHMSNNTILMALDRMGYRGKMTGHGFRTLAMSTIMEKLGYRREIPDLQLAHSKRGDVAKAYDRADFLPDRVIMMQDWADYLDKLS